MKKYKSKDCLFIYFQNNNIMVNKREKNLLYNFYFRQTAFSLILSLFFYLYLLFFPTFFVLIFSYLSGTFTFFFADISGRNFLSSWTFLSGTFYPGGGVHVHSPCVRACTPRYTFSHARTFDAHTSDLLFCLTLFFFCF